MEYGSPVIVHGREGEVIEMGWVEGEMLIQVRDNETGRETWFQEDEVDIIEDEVSEVPTVGAPKRLIYTLEEDTREHSVKTKKKSKHIDRASVRRWSYYPGIPLSLHQILDTLQVMKEEEVGLRDAARIVADEYGISGGRLILEKFSTLGSGWIKVPEVERMMYLDVTRFEELLTQKYPDHKELIVSVLENQ